LGPLPARPLAAAPALLLVAVSLWEVCATRRDATSVPGDDAWREAAASVRARYRPGDLIVFAPDWVDPVGRLHLGDLITLDMAGRMDAARYPRIWELSIRGAHAKDTAGLSPVASEDHGGVTVRRFEHAAAVVTAELIAQPVPGTSVELAEVGFEPHRCLQIAPPPWRPTVLTFPRVALGRELVGYAGIADVFTRRDVRSPGYIAVAVGGELVGFAAPGVDDGWVRFAGATRPGIADVTVIVLATDRDRRICFAAEARQ
jgi:hypothetical protein